MDPLYEDKQRSFNLMLVHLLQIGHLFSGPLESCHSSLLLENGKGLRALLLTLVGLQVGPTLSIMSAYGWQDFFFKGF